LLTCDDLTVTFLRYSPQQFQPYISEFHYDNNSEDKRAFIEIVTPYTSFLEDYSVVLYDGNPTVRDFYDSLLASTGVSTVVNDVRYTVIDYAGIEKGGSPISPAPDGIALFGPSGLIEFLSYEGSFTVKNDPSMGMSIDIGVAEAGTEAPGMSLQRCPDMLSMWSGPIANTRGLPNANCLPASVPVPVPVPVPIPVPVPVTIPAPVPVPVSVPVPVLVPVKAPFAVPVAAPQRCGLFGLSLFCPRTRCGIFGRLLGLCR
jgi:hypothetical protein